MSDTFDPLATATLFTNLSGELRERTFRLSVVAGPDAGKEIDLERGTTMVGSHDTNDLVLTDDTISRYHLELQVKSAGLQATDLSSTNGTFHGDTRLGEILIQGVSRLRLGKNTTVEIVPREGSVALGGYDDSKFGNAVGASEAMRNLFALLTRVAATDATLLLEGETGTGKEVIADAVHRESDRKDHPFVVVDCASIPHNLIASELFGHKKGSFTGATADKEGLVRGAHKGTLFLDEIGELSLELQPQLLRALEKREVRPVGGTEPVEVDIRVVAATNRNLKEMVKEGTFREDLYYRLAVVRAVVPPLRERAEDIPLLANHFADNMGAGFSLPPSLVQELQGHGWPGNVRELRNVVERALSLGRAGFAPSASELVTATPGQRLAGAKPGSVDLAPGSGVLELPFKEAKGQLIESFERAYLTELLKKHNGNISRAASAAGIDRNYIHRLVKKYGLTVERS